MDKYKPSIPSFTNERLNKILKGFYDKKLNVASYGEYNETIRDEKKIGTLHKLLKKQKEN
jgi:hypothetical protein